MKITFPAGIAVFALGLAAWTVRPAAAADLTTAYTWKPMKIGGGGWVVGLDISPTERGLIYARTDVSGAYRWTPATASWKQLVTSSSVLADFQGYGNYPGVESLVGAPKDPDIAYLALGGKSYGVAVGQVLRSTDRGEHWTATSLASHRVRMEPNGEGRQEGERLAVDPENSNVVFFGSIRDGLWTTRDGGGTWTKVAAVPDGTPAHGVNTIHFDPAAGTIDPGTGKVRTRGIFVTVDGAGVYRTADGGDTWTCIANPVPGKAESPRDAALGPDRTYYVAYAGPENGSGTVWRCSPAGVWTEITPPPPSEGGKAYCAIAVDPRDAKHLVAMCNGGRCSVSDDQGATWSFHSFRLDGGNIQWMSRQANYWLSVGQLAFDPFEPGKLWFAEGFGVWFASDLTTPQIAWHAASEGIEEVCGNDVIAPPGGPPVAAMWDASAFAFDDVDAYTARRAVPNFMSAWALDWCASDPKFLAGVFQNHLNFPPHANSSGYSTDGGRTWKRFAAVDNGTVPADLRYGVIAVSANSPDGIVWCPAAGKLPYYTKDRGATWQRCAFDGMTATGLNNYSAAQKPLCADRVLADTFYFYHPQQGVYRSVDGGAHFTRMGNPGANGYNAFLKATPGRARDLWYAGGVGGRLSHSADGGATWTTVPGLEEAFCVGFGKARKEGGEPTIFAAGAASGKKGVFRTTDFGATWDQICGYPLGIYDAIEAVDGDKEVFGKVYVGFSSAGFAYGAEKPSP